VSLYGPVRADEKVGLGKAAVKLSMEWKGVAVASTTHTLTVLDAPGDKPLPVSPRLLRSLPHPDRTSSLWRVAFTPKGLLFVSGYPSGTVQLWDVGSGKEVRRISSPHGYRGSADYALTPADFSTLYVPLEGRKIKRDPNDAKKPITVVFDGKVLAWDLATGKPRPGVEPRKGLGVAAAYLSPGGKRLVAVERGGYTIGSDPPADLVRLYDTATGKSWPLGEGYGQAVFSADGRRIYLARSRYRGNRGGTLAVFDARGKELATLLEVKGLGLSWPVLSSSGNALVVELSKGRINEPATLKVFDLKTNKEIASFASGGAFPFTKPAFSPDGALLAAGDYDGQVTIWDVRKKAVARKHRFKGMSMGLEVAFSPDGRWLAAPARVKTEREGGWDVDPLDLPQPRVFLFDLTREAPPEEVVCPHGWSGGVAFSPDGKTLAVGGAGAVHLFDVSRPAK
jgi:WD40 repeat protein